MHEKEAHHQSSYLLEKCPSYRTELLKSAENANKIMNRITLVCRHISSFFAPNATVVLYGHLAAIHFNTHQFLQKFTWKSLKYAE